MKVRETQISSRIVMSEGYWRSIQKDLQDCIDELNTITSMIAAHQYESTWDQETVIERIDAKTREMRKILENIIAPI